MSLGSRIRENLPIRIVAVLVAVFVWFHVTESTEFEQMVEVPLRLINLPPNLTLVGEIPTQVSVRVRARGRFIGMRTKGMYVPVDLSGAQLGRVSRLLSPADVEVPPGMRVEVLRILSPGVVTVELDSLLTRTVPVVTALKGMPEKGFVRAGLVMVNPPSIKVQGPRKYVKDLEALPTEPVNITGSRRPLSARARVSLAGLKGVIAIPEIVSVTVPVERAELFEVDAVPVLVETSNESKKVSWEPREVKLTIRGARSLFKKWSKEEISLEIEAGSLTPGYYEFVAETMGRTGIRLVPFTVGPPAQAPDTTRGGEALELHATIFLPEFIELDSLSPHTFHILIE